MTRYPNGLSSFGVPVLPGMPALFGGSSKAFFCDPSNGSDDNRGNKPSQAVKTLYKAHSLMTAGSNDVCYLIGDGSTAATARLSLANAVAVDSTATTGALTWSKNACHLIGITAPTMMAQRARIAPPSGTYTQATFNSGNLVVVSASGCVFSNVSMFHGFSTGGTGQIGLTISGGRNYFNNVHIGGVGDAASAADTGSASLLLSGSTGENTFDGCTVGLDTVTKTVAVPSIWWTGANPRNVFRNCVFPQTGNTAGAIFGKIGTGGIDRFQLFQDCLFVNAMDSGATAITGAFAISASAGGSVILKNCTLVGDGSANWATDATGLAQMYIDGAAPTNSSSGLAVNPS